MAGQHWTTINPTEHDIKLVVCDMDGTLLDGDGEIPSDFWTMLERMEDRGILFAPASGRQYATLSGMFGHRDSISTFVAENGTMVVKNEEVVSLTPVTEETKDSVVRSMRTLEHRNLGAVVSGRQSAYIERGDKQFIDEVSTYYHELLVVDDLEKVDDDFLKVAIFDFDGAADETIEALADVPAGNQVVISGSNWIDVMLTGAHKGKAVADLQKNIGITPAETVVFGDYLNDYEMIGQAELSFAMENAHPDVIQAANYLAPHHAEYGVIQVLEKLLS